MDQEDQLRTPSAFSRTTIFSYIMWLVKFKTCTRKISVTIDVFLYNENNNWKRWKLHEIGSMGNNGLTIPLQVVFFVNILNELFDLPIISTCRKELSA